MTSIQNYQHMQHGQPPAVAAHAPDEQDATAPPLNSLPSLPGDIEGRYHGIITTRLNSSVLDKELCHEST